MTTYLVPLPWATPPLSANDRLHHMAKARIVASVLSDARLAIRNAKLPTLAGANLTLHFQIPNKRRRDGSNLSVTLKVVEDALVQEGVLHDDSWVEVPRSGHEIHPPVAGEVGRLWLEIEDLSGVA